MIATDRVCHYDAAVVGAWAVLTFSRDELKTTLKLTLRAIAQIRSCDVLSAYSVNVPLKLILRVIA